MTHPTPPVIMPRQLGAVNWIGFASLLRKEVQRFLSIYVQTVGAPMVTSLLFLAIFSLALGRAVETIKGVPFVSFVAPGLIIMSMAQNAFANTSSSLVISKVQGNIVDVLMPPISAAEFVAAYALGGVIRGILVGAASLVGIMVFIDLPIVNIPMILAFGFLGSLMLALFGLLGGIWSDKFDQMAAITNFVITPFAFLSGTFYSIDRLPEPFLSMAFFNPFFYMIDGFRGGFLGYTDANPLTGMSVLVAVNVVLLLLCYRLIASGYKLKA